MLPQLGESGDLPHMGEATQHRPGTSQVLRLVGDDAAVGTLEQDAERSDGVHGVSPCVRRQASPDSS